MGYVGSYMWGLRQKVGHQRLIVAGVAIMVTDDEGKILCGKRTGGDGWCYIGGSMELGQSVEDCLRAELKEETGLDLTDYTFVGVSSNPAETTYIYPNHDEVQVVNFVFQVPLLGRPLTMDEEHTELTFAPLEALPQPFKTDGFAAINVYKAFLKTGKVQLN